MGRLERLLLAGALVTAGVLIVPSASATEVDCIPITYTITEELSGKHTICPEQGIGGLPDVPGVGGPDVSIHPDPVGYWSSRLPGAPDLPGTPGLPSTGDVNATPCADDEVGYHAALQETSVFVCVSAEYRPPSQIVPLPTTDMLTPQVHDCPDQLPGKSVTVWEWRLGACIIIDYWIPTTTDGGASVETEPCEVPAGRGDDPAVFIGDGGVAVCVVPMVEQGHTPSPDDLPEIGHSLEPCSVRSVDPEVTINDGGLFVCVTFGVDGGST